MPSLAQALPDAINRAHLVRDQLYDLRNTPGVIVEPQIALITQEIREAVDALGSGDVVRMLRAYEALKGYER